MNCEESDGRTFNWYLHLQPLPCSRTWTVVVGVPLQNSLKINCFSKQIGIIVCIKKCFSNINIKITVLEIH